MILTTVFRPPVTLPPGKPRAEENINQSARTLPAIVMRPGKARSLDVLATACWVGLEIVDDDLNDVADQLIGQSLPQMTRPASGFTTTLLLSGPPPSG
jgi:hypothetical protein